MEAGGERISKAVWEMLHRSRSADEQLQWELQQVGKLAKDSYHTPPISSRFVRSATREEQHDRIVQQLTDPDLIPQDQHFISTTFTPSRWRQAINIDLQDLHNRERLTLQAAPQFAPPALKVTRRRLVPEDCAESSSHVRAESDAPLARPTVSHGEPPVAQQIGQRGVALTRSLILYLLSEPFCRLLHRIRSRPSSSGKRPATFPRPKGCIQCVSFRVWGQDLRIIPGTLDPVYTTHWDVYHNIVQAFGILDILLAFREELQIYHVTAWQRVKEGFTERGSSIFSKNFEQLDVEVVVSPWNRHPIHRDQPTLW